MLSASRTMNPTTAQMAWSRAFGPTSRPMPKATTAIVGKTINSKSVNRGFPILPCCLATDERSAIAEFAAQRPRRLQYSDASSIPDSLAAPEPTGQGSIHLHCCRHSLDLACGLRAQSNVDLCKLAVLLGTGTGCERPLQRDAVVVGSRSGREVARFRKRPSFVSRRRLDRPGPTMDRANSEANHLASA